MIPRCLGVGNPKKWLKTKIKSTTYDTSIDSAHYSTLKKFEST